jgi:hypothetical protein
MKKRAICIDEPRGRGGLEGYSLDEKYFYERVEPADKPPYYRVWPVAEDAYYETCSPQTFNRYFTLDN